MKRYGRLLSLICFCLCSHQLQATHIVGGDIAVQWISGNDFRVTLTFFKDCRISNPSLALFDDTIACGIYDKATNVIQQSFLMTNPVKDTLDLGDTCFTPPNLCVQRGVYQTIVTIPDNPNGYYIAWQRCCRNFIINNIQNPGNTGMVFYTEIPDPVLHDNSPVFGSYPDAYFCVSQVNNPSFTCTDADGDSLVYSLITPLSGSTDSTAGNDGFFPDSILSPGAYSSVLWETSYSASNMIGGTPPMTIDSATGIITAQPNNLGVYVFAVRVEEYRTGIKIGEVRRDIQYWVVVCPTYAAPVFTAPVITSLAAPSADTSFTVVAGENLSIALNLTSADLNDSVFLYGSSELFLSSLPGMTYSFHNDSAQGTVHQDFFLQTTCDAIREAPYHLKFNGIKRACDSLMITVLNIDVYVKSLLDGSLDSLVPNVFTPNDDGKNDFFHIKATPNYCFDNFKLKIYNRWGTLMFETNDFLFQWDGTNKGGTKLSAGVYYYILDATFEHNSFTKRGFIQLIK